MARDQIRNENVNFLESIMGVNLLMGVSEKF